MANSKTPFVLCHTHLNLLLPHVFPEGGRGYIVGDETTLDLWGALDKSCDKQHNVCPSKTHVLKQPY